MERRSVLAAAGTTLTVFSAGCSSLQSLTSEEGTRIEQIAAINRDYTEYTIHVLVTEDDNPLYFDALEINAASEDSDEVDEVFFENYPDDPGEYTVYAWIDEQPRTDWAEFDVTERESCTNVTITVGGQDDSEEVVIRSTEGCS